MIYDSRNPGSVDTAMPQQVFNRHAQFIFSMFPVRGNTPANLYLPSGEYTDHDVGITHINGQQHFFHPFSTLLL